MKEWEQFEVAVEQFVAALDPRASVRRNVLVPDRDTGHSRQRDVWVETTVCNLFPVKILISCKDWAAKLDEGDIDAFIGELRSSGAHMGVIYASSGFTEPAIRKAQVVGISCYKLYSDEPPDIPGALLFQFYCCVQSYRFGLAGDDLQAWTDVSLAALFERNSPDDTAPNKLLDVLCRGFEEGGKESIKALTERSCVPPPWVQRVSFTDRVPPLHLSLEGKWRLYRSKLEASLLQGTYSFTENRFVGTSFTPWIDMKGEEPGPGWEVLNPETPEIQRGLVVVTLYADIRRTLTEDYSARKVGDFV